MMSSRSDRAARVRAWCEAVLRGEIEEPPGPPLEERNDLQMPDTPSPEEMRRYIAEFGGGTVAGYVKHILGG